MVLMMKLHNPFRPHIAAITNISVIGHRSGARPGSEPEPHAEAFSSPAWPCAGGAKAGGSGASADIMVGTRVRSTSYHFHDYLCNRHVHR